MTAREQREEGIDIECTLESNIPSELLTPKGLLLLKAHLQLYTDEWSNPLMSLVTSLGCSLEHYYTGDQVLNMSPWERLHI